MLDTRSVRLNHYVPHHWCRNPAKSFGLLERSAFDPRRCSLNYSPGRWPAHFNNALQGRFNGSSKWFGVTRTEKPSRPVA